MSRRIPLELLPDGESNASGIGLCFESRDNRESAS
jgi:hypothetical protein